MTSVGESGRTRFADDQYPTPTLNSAGLAVGLQKMNLALPWTALDPCGGVGQLRETMMRILPVNILLTDLRPQRCAAAFYETSAPTDATIARDLTGVVRRSRARMILTNPPFERVAYSRILANCLDLLRTGELELVGLMQRAQRHLDCEIGARETAGEARFHAVISCPWRAWLWPQRPGEPSPKGSYVWLIYRSKPRPRACYETWVVTKAEAEKALSS